VAADLPARKVPSGPIVFGYDGSPGSERSLRLTAPLVAPKPALVVTVWDPRVGFGVLTPSVPPAPIDIRAALEIDESLNEGAQRMAEQGAATARQLGFDAEALAVARWQMLAGVGVWQVHSNDPSPRAAALDEVRIAPAPHCSRPARTHRIAKARRWRAPSPARAEWAETPRRRPP
jgi:hypothetical protein